MPGGCKGPTGGERGEWLTDWQETEEIRRRRKTCAGDVGGACGGLEAFTFLEHLRGFGCECMGVVALLLD